MRAPIVKLLLCLCLLSWGVALHAQDDAAPSVVLKPVEIALPSEGVFDFYWCPDSTCFVMMLEDDRSTGIETAQIYNATGKKTATISIGGESDYMLRTNFSPDGLKLSSASYGAGVWDIKSGDVLTTIEDCLSWGIDWSRDSSKFMTYCEERGHSEIYDVATGKQLLWIPGQTSWLFDNDFFARFDRDKPDVDIQNTATRSHVDKLKTDGAVKYIQPGTQSNQLLVFSNVIELWDMDTRQQLQTFPYTDVSFAWNETTRRLTVFNRSSATVYNTDTGEAILTAVFTSRSPLPYLWAWNDDASLMSTHGTKWENCTELCEFTDIYDGQNGDLLHHFELNEDDNSTWIPGHSTWRVYKAGVDSLEIQDISSDEVLYKLPYVNNDTYNQLYVSPDGQHVATYTWDTLYLWDIPADS